MILRREFLKIGGLACTVPAWAHRLFAQSAAAAAKLENMTAGVKPLGPEDYAERQERARRLMAENKLDAVFLPGGVNLSYFTTVSWGRERTDVRAVLNRKGLPDLGLSGFRTGTGERVHSRRPGNPGLGGT